MLSVLFDQQEEAILCSFSHKAFEYWCWRVRRIMRLFGLVGADLCGRGEGAIVVFVQALRVSLINHTSCINAL